MKRSTVASTLSVLTRCLGVLVPGPEREYLLGDLSEETSRRLAAEGSFKTIAWWTGQATNIAVVAPHWHWRTWRSRQRELAAAAATRTVMLTKEKLMHGVWSDLRFVLRQLSRSPGFVLTSVLILGLGLGANVTIFGLANAVVFKAMPGIQPADEHFMVLSRTEQDRDFEGALSYPDFVDLRLAFGDQAMIAARDAMPVGLRLGDVTERRRGAVVSGNYFSVLGVDPAVGRTLTPEDDQALLSSPVAVISHQLWRDRFGSRQGAIGQQVSLNGTSFEIVGVAPRGFRGDQRFDRVDIWVPMMMQPVARPSGFDVFNERESTWMGVLGRRQVGVPLSTLEPLARSQERDFTAYSPEDTRRREFTLAPGLGPEPAERRAASALIGALLLVTSLVLVIACANVANLILARSNRRVSEISLRRALGAGQGRIVRLLLTESLIVASVAAAVGIAMALAVRGALMNFLPAIARNSGIELAIDARVAGFAILLALASGALFGLAPTVSSNGLRPSRSLAKSSAQGPKSRLRSSLVVAQLALSVVLLMSAGLLLESMRRLQSVPPGFEAEGVLSAAIDLGITQRSPQEMGEFYGSLLERLNESPQVAAAAMSSAVPLSGSGDTFGGLLIEGNEPPPGRPGWSSRVNLVTSGFLETLSIPLLTGRDFDRTDTFSSTPVAIVNRAFQRRYWPDQDVLGKTIDMPYRGKRQVVRVVGLVNDAHYRSLSRAVEPLMYLPVQQRGTARVAVVLRTKAGGTTATLTDTLQRSAAELDNEVPIFAVAPLSAVVNESLSQTRMVGSLISLFGVLALVLASVGLYGVVACLVSERRKEIGIRLALGAKPAAVIKGLFQRCLRLSASAVGLGLLGSIGVGRLLSSFLYGTHALNPSLMFSVAVLLLAVTVLASIGPLLLAARLQPAKVLRADD